MRREEAGRHPGDVLGGSGLSYSRRQTSQRSMIFIQSSHLQLLPLVYRTVGILIVSVLSYQGRIPGEGRGDLGLGALER